MKKEIKRLVIISGARPNFMKIAPLIRALRRYKEFEPVLIHTGQHFDYNMSVAFFKNLHIPEPDINLGVNSGSAPVQISRIMLKLSRIFKKDKPDLVIVVGDVNSTLAGALAAYKSLIPLAHVEAGLRSFDMSMPEEVNRILTDNLSDMLFTTHPVANRNLINEGIPKNRIFLVGDTMIDSLLHELNTVKRKSGKKLGLGNSKYAVLTLHRQANVDSRSTFSSIISSMDELSKKIKIFFPVHPRALKRIKSFKIKCSNNIRFLPPLNYSDFLVLMLGSKFVITDSGGIQVETSVLNIPCLTLRDNTERPFTLTQGTNVLIGKDKGLLIRESDKILSGKWKKSRLADFWDGKSCERIAGIIFRNLCKG